jgi:hypothetical protein
MEQLGFLWADIHEILYLSISRKTADRFKALLKLERNNWYFVCRPIYIFVVSRSILFRKKNVSDKMCRED